MVVLHFGQFRLIMLGILDVMLTYFEEILNNLSEILAILTEVLGFIWLLNVGCLGRNCWLFLPKFLAVLDVFWIKCWQFCRK